MDSSFTTIGYLSDFSNSTIEMDSSDSSSVAVINSSCNEETDSDMDVSSIIPYQHEPTTGKLVISSEESSEEDNENDGRVDNMDWYIIGIRCTPII